MQLAGWAQWWDDSKPKLHTAGRGMFPSELRPFAHKVSELSYHSPSEVIEPKHDVKIQAGQPSNFTGKKTEIERQEELPHTTVSYCRTKQNSILLVPLENSPLFFCRKSKALNSAFKHP